MLSKLLPVFLTVLLAASSCGATKPYIADIRPLQVIYTEQNSTGLCTAWATKVNDVTRWITASHCVALNENGSLDMGVTYLIGGQPSTPVKVDFDRDLAMFIGPKSSHPFKVAFGEAELGQHVWSFSYFWMDGVYTEGVASIPTGIGQTVFNLTGGPGSSGAPILTPDNLIIGVVQSGPCGSGDPCPIIASAPVKSIRAFLYGDESQ